MNTQVRGLLVSNHKNWMLDFKNLPTPHNATSGGIAVKAGAVVICLFVWPLLFLMGSVVFSFSSFDYLKSVWNQRKMVTVLSNENNLWEFAAKRAESCVQQIENLKAEAMNLMARDLKNPDELNLHIPPKKTSMRCWNYFSWDTFLRADFFEKSNIPKNPDKIVLLKLEGIKIKINFLNQQKDLFLQDNTGLEKIKAVTQMSFIKNIFQRQRSKEWMIRSVCCLFPLGLFADVYLQRLRNDRLTYENNKSFLPAGLGLDSYKDLIDAHNRLLSANPFLVPYIVD